MEIIGWLGGILFAICAIPQAYACWKQKHAEGLSWLFLLTWTWGEIFTLIYVLCRDDTSYPLIFNYTFNLIALGVIIYYKIIGEKYGYYCKTANTKRT